MSTTHVFVSALNDSGGGFLTRLLDGHPSLAVFPFELQLGVQTAPAGYDHWFPAKYRWPRRIDREHDIFELLTNEEIRAAQRGEPKFRRFKLDLDMHEWKSAFEAQLSGEIQRGYVVSTLLKTFFAAWRDGPGSSAKIVVAHCPLLALDWDLIRADLPDARMLHVVRSPFSVFSDTKRRRPGLGAEGFALRWSLVNTVAHWFAAREPERFRIVRYDALLGARRDVMLDLSNWLGVAFHDALLTPTWNGTTLEGMGPFGGIPNISIAYDHEQARQLSAHDRERIAALSASTRVLVGIPDGAAEDDANELRENFADPPTNLALSAIREKDIPAPLEYEMLGDFWGLLDDLGIALVVTREYEHLIVLLGGDGGRPWQSAMPIPHPSGAFVSSRDGMLVVSSTRVPNQLFWFEPLTEEAWEREIVPKEVNHHDGSLYLPIGSRALPGSLYIHDVVVVDDAVYVTATGHNFVARIDPLSGWRRVWWPRLLDDLGAEAFAENWLQLNSIGLGPSGLGDAFFTAFSDETGGAKPWKEGYGPRGRGVVFSARTRDVVLRGLTCPHSATVHDGALWLCDSGFGSIGVTSGDERGDLSYAAVTRLAGFTRGLAFSGRYAIVGMSKVIPRYEPYAPGVDPNTSRCGLAIVDVTNGEIAAQLWWPDGLQIYDVQVMPNVSRPMLPSVDRSTGVSHLSFLG